MQTRDSINPSFNRPRRRQPRRRSPARASQYVQPPQQLHDAYSSCTIYLHTLKAERREQTGGASGRRGAAQTSLARGP